jgi:hypothetical protein
VTGPAGGPEDSASGRRVPSDPSGPRTNSDRSGASPADRSPTEREAARLRWELSRLHSRRSVRAALLATEAAGARPGGAGDVLATLRGRRIVEDLDVIAPASARPRFAYPHLEVVHLAVDPPFRAAAPHRRVTPDGARSTLDGSRPSVAGADPAAQSPDTIRLQPPDLVVLDDLAGLARWPERGRRALRDAVPSAGAVLGLVTSAADAAEVAAWPLDLLLLGPGVERLDVVAQLAALVPSLPLLPGIDPRMDGPVGWRRRPARTAVVVGAGGSAPAAALASDLGIPVATSAEDTTDAAAAIVAEPTGWEGLRLVLSLLGRGIPVVVAEGTGMPDELAGLVEAVPRERLLATASGWGEDLDVRERRSVQLRRTVLRQHTHRARLETVLGHLGIPRRRPERISVLLATRRPGRLEDAAAQVAAQDHPDVELVAALHGDGFDDDAETRLAALHPGPTRVVRVEGAAPLGDVLNAALDEATGTLIAKMDDDDLYGPGHLSDLVVALDYSGADVVGRWSNETHLVEADVTIAQDLDRQERWAHHLPGATMLVRGDVLRAVRFRRVPRHVDTHLLRGIHAAGGSAYATHRFGFIRRRHEDHTYDPGDARFDAAAADEEPRPDRGARPRPGLDRSVLEV